MNTQVKHKHAVNAVVTIVKPEHTYTSWSTKFEEYGFRNTSENHPLSKGVLAKITRCDVHDDGETPIYAVRAVINGEERECIMGEKGISPVPRKPMTEFVFKQIWPDLSLCHYDRKNSILHLNGSALDVTHGKIHEDVVLRVHNPETGGYGDFKRIGLSAGNYVEYLGYGISIVLRCYFYADGFHDVVKKVSA